MLTISCPVCHSQETQAFFTDRGYDKKEYKIVRCVGCHFSYLNPQPTDDELGLIYKDYYGDFGDHATIEGQLAFRKSVFEDVAKILEKFKKGNRELLDLGCGNGEFLMLAREKGWKVSGIEYAGPAADFARTQRNIDVTTASLSDFDFKSKKFEAITILDVLEHVRNPQQTLSSIFRALKPGGGLVIRVPNTPFQIFKARIQRLRHGADFTTLATPLHLNHFDAKALRSMVEREGFKILSLDPGAADGVGTQLILKKAYLMLSKTISSLSGLQIGNILCVVAQKPD